MKTFLKYMAVCCISVALFASCNDDFMQQDPIQELAEGAFLKNEGDLPIYLNQLYDLYIMGHQRGNAYDEVPPLASRGSQIIYGDLVSDNAVAFTGSAGDPNNRLDGAFITPTSGTSTGWDWTKLRRVNYFIDHYQDALGSVASPSDLNKWLAEAYFFKAWDYYTKIYIFGDVPWISGGLNIDSEELYAPRAPRAEIVDSVMKMLDFSVAHIQNVKNANGRINRDMANFLKARFCLFEGTFRKYHTDLGLTNTHREFLTKCVEACEAIIASGNYSLFNDGSSNAYWKMFQFNQNPATDKNTEAILVRVYDGDKLGHGTPRYFSMNRGNASGRYSKGLTKGFLEDYLCIDGKPIYTGESGGSYTTNPLFKGYEGADWRELDNRDPRLTQTISRPGEYITVWDRGEGSMDKDKWGVRYPEITYNCPTANQVAWGGPSITGYQIIKHWTPNPEDNGTTSSSKQTAVVFRYGEVLLMLAEAKAELGTLTNADLDRTVNALRERAGFNFTQYPNSRLSLENVPADPRLDKIYADKLDYSVAPILREIRRERRIEMAMEGLRREDLARWKAGKLMEVPLRGMKFTAEKQKLYDGSNTAKPTIAMKASLGSDVFVDSEGFIVCFPRAARITNGTLVWENRYYFWPIPLQELTLNKNLKQNPGWNDISR